MLRYHSLQKLGGEVNVNSDYSLISLQCFGLWCFFLATKFEWMDFQLFCVIIQVQRLQIRKDESSSVHVHCRIGLWYSNKTQARFYRVYGYCDCLLPTGYHHGNLSVTPWQQEFVTIVSIHCCHGNLWMHFHTKEVTTMALLDILYSGYNHGIQCHNNTKLMDIFSGEDYTC